MKAALHALLILLSTLILPLRASAQGAPDVVFSVSYYTTGSSTPTGTQAPATGWSDTYTNTSGTNTKSTSVSGSVTGSSLEANTSGQISASGTSLVQVEARQRVSVYVRGRASVDVTATNEGEAAITSGSTDNQSAYYSPGYWGSGIIGVTTNSTGSVSNARTDSTTRHYDPACGTSGTTFPEYPGVTYTLTEGTYSPTNSVLLRTDGGGTSSTLSAQGKLTVSATLGAAVPLVTINSPTVGGISKPYPDLNDSFVLSNSSSDPDNVTGSGICSYQWSILKPDGTVQSGSNSTITVSGTIPGEYIATLTVTDNEGTTNTTSLPISVGERLVQNGNADGPQYCAKKPNSATPTTCVKVAMSGNAHMSSLDPVSTRGYPLVNNIHLNSQSHFTSRNTKMGNATFSYGIAVDAGVTYSRRGVPQVRWFVVDADGTEVDYGAFSGSPVTQPGSIATLTIVSGGYQLTNAGPPESVEKGGNWTYDFDVNGKLMSLTDPSNNVQQLTYDSNGDPTQVEDLSSARIIEFQYDTPGLIARVVEGAGVAVTHLDYDTGKLASITVKDSLGNTIQETDISYNVLGQFSSVVMDNDPASAVNVTYQHAGSGIYVANMTFQGGDSNLNYFSAPLSGAKFRTRHTTPGGGVYLYDYDANMDLLRVTAPIHHGATVAPYKTYTWNAARQVATHSNNSGSSTYTYTYDSLGNITNILNSFSGSWTITYSGFDLLTVSDTIGTQMTYAYTDTNNPHSPTTITDGASRTWTKTYNQYGQVLTVVPPTGSPQGTTTFEYEETTTDPAYGYLRKITNGAGDEETFDSYSPLGDLLARTTSPSSGVTHTTNYTYDPSRRMLSVQNPDSTIFSWSYVGRLLDSTVDEAGTLNEFEWTPATEELASVSAPLSHELNWTYNDSRQVSQFTDARTNATAYTYGIADELKLATYPDSSVIEYKYDSRGRLSTITEPRGRITTLTYDNRNRVLTNA